MTISKTAHKGLGILSVAAISAVLAFTLAGCGSNNSASASASAASASAAAASTSASAASASAAASSASASAASMTLEQYLATDAGKAELANVVNTSSFEQFGTVEITAKGNDLVYTITVNQALTSDPIAADTFSDETQKTMAAGIADFESIIGSNDMTITLVFKDNTGKQWHTVVFNDKGIASNVAEG